jgi:hypothetical protein
MNRAICGALAALFAMAWSAPVSASPELTVVPESVSIAVPAGSRVAVVGVMRRARGLVPGFERWEGILVDEDGDGRIEIALERPAHPAASRWIAVDLGTGEWAAAERPGAAGERVEGQLPTGGEISAGATVWPVASGIVEVLVVRPGEGEAAGAWGGSVWDGGPADGDGLADGAAGVVPASLRPVGDSGAAPETFAAGDLLIAVTPGALRYGITRVVEGAEEVSR